MILITRPSPSGEALCQALKAEGIPAYHSPLFTIKSGKDSSTVSYKINQLPKESLIIALSQHVVRHIHGKISTHLSHHYLAIGHTTAQLLQEKVNQPVIYPPEHKQSSEGILSLNILQSVYNKHILILKGNNGRPLLKNQLIARGAIVESCECYTRQYIDYNKNKLINFWKYKEITIIVVTSNEILIRLLVLTPYNDRTWLLDRHLIVASQRQAQKARQLGWHKIIIAPSAQLNNLLNTIKLITD